MGLVQVLRHAVRAGPVPGPALRLREGAARYACLVVRIALGQINTTVGDLEGNVDRMARAALEASSAGADLISFPELAVTGYPPEDLVLRPQFVKDNLAALED